MENRKNTLEKVCEIGSERAENWLKIAPQGYEKTPSQFYCLFVVFEKNKPETKEIGVRHGRNQKSTRRLRRHVFPRIGTRSKLLLLRLKKATPYLTFGCFWSCITQPSLYQSLVLIMPIDHIML